MDRSELLDLASPIAGRHARKEKLADADAADLLQNAVTRFLATWPDGSGPDNPAAWLETTIKNLVTDHHRFVARHGADAIDDQEDALIQALAGGLSQHPSAGPVRDDLVARIFALVPEADADVIRQRFLGGRPAIKVAADLGITPAAVDQRAKRAKKKLRDALAARPDLLAELKQSHPATY